MEELKTTYQNDFLEKYSEALKSRDKLESHSLDSFEAFAELGFSFDNLKDKLTSDELLAFTQESIPGGGLLKNIIDLGTKCRRAKVKGKVVDPSQLLLGLATSETAAREVKNITKAVNVSAWIKHVGTTIKSMRMTLKERPFIEWSAFEQEQARDIIKPLIVLAKDMAITDGLDSTTPPYKESLT